MSKQYQKAGVNIELGNQVKSKLPQLLSSTNRNEVLGKVGGFGGLFLLDTKKYKKPVLVSSVDGVGTKLKIAFEYNKHNTIGIDLVNKGEYDVSGTIIGVVEKDSMITGENISDGDIVIGVQSNGLHTNGYSLARKILFDKMRYGVEDYINDIDNILGDELLKPHMSYLSLVNKVKKYVNGIAHITGGGFYDNIPRVLPRNLDVTIEKKSWQVMPIFELIQKYGKVSDEEMYHVFNMGIGMTFILNNKYVNKFLKESKDLKYKSYIIGCVKKGDGKVKIL